MITLEIGKAISLVCDIKNSSWAFLPQRRFYTRRNVSGMSWQHPFFLILQMRKTFVYWHFPEMSIPLKRRNHFNFFAPNKCRFLFKPIIFVYSCKQSESLQYGLFTVHNINEMAAYFNLNNMKYQKCF